MGSEKEREEKTEVGKKEEEFWEDEDDEEEEEWIKRGSSLNKRKAQKLFEKFIQDLWKVAAAFRILQNPLLTTMGHAELSAGFSNRLEKDKIPQHNAQNQNKFG